MKALFTILLTMSVFKSFSQVNEGYNYIVRKPVLMYPYDFQNSTVSSRVGLTAHDGITFDVLRVAEDSQLGDIYVIRITPPIQAAGEPQKYQGAGNINSSNTNNLEVYCVKMSEFDGEIIEKRYYTWNYNYKVSLGTLIMPMKLRPRKAGIPMDFTSDFTLGTSLGLSFRVAHYTPSYLSIIATGGVSNITVDSLTTRGTVLERTTLGGFTYGFGAVFETGVFQAAIVVGWDVLGGVKSKDWIYNNRNWVSLGIGVQLWKPNSQE